MDENLKLELKKLKYILDKIFFTLKWLNFVIRLKNNTKKKAFWFTKESIAIL